MFQELITTIAIFPETSGQITFENGFVGLKQTSRILS